MAAVGKGSQEGHSEGARDAGGGAVNARGEAVVLGGHRGENGGAEGGGRKSQSGPEKEEGKDDGSGVMNESGPEEGGKSGGGEKGAKGERETCTRSIEELSREG